LFLKIFQPNSHIVCLIQFQTDRINLIQIGQPYHIAAIGTIGSKSTFSMKHFVS